MRTLADLSKLINQSGFPLQLAIDRMVQDQTDDTGWRVLHREYGWKHPDGQSGFIDLVLEDRHGTSVLVVECKRVQEADWLFLDPLPSPGPTRRTRLWATNTAASGGGHCAYYDAISSPESSESMYCIVAGQDPKNKPMLERLASETTTSTEALALEEQPLALKQNYGLRMYVSVIVTTARLHLSSFDPKMVLLSSGETAEASHQVVPWIRFRKQLSSEFAVPPRNADWDFGERALAKEKQVFVVNAGSLSNFLSQWEFASRSLSTLMQT